MPTRHAATIWRFTAVAAVAFGSGCTGRPDAEALFQQYVAAVNAHDLETIASMTAPDAVWGRREGREALMEQNRFDAAMGIQLTPRDIVSRGDTVEAILTERTASHRAHGPDSTLHYVRFVFLDGQLVSKGRTRPDPLTPEEFARHAQPFREWVSRTHPEAPSKLLSAPNIMRINEDTGRLLASLLDEWVRAGRP